MALSIWVVGGLFLDGWAHHQIPELETFFTPWHAVFYSGFLAVAGFVVISALRSRGRGQPWASALPAGYQLSLWGVLMFAVGGIGDMIWHLVFGIEADVEALLSPTHLLLALGLSLIISGPLRAFWSRPNQTQSLPRQFPMLISLTLLLSVLTFMTQYSHPFVNLFPSFRIAEDIPRASAVYHDLVFHHIAEGALNAILQTVLLMGLVLLAVRKQNWMLPWGSLTILLTLNAAALSVFEYTYRLVPVAVLAGLAADTLLHGLRPSAQRQAQLRWFAFLVPAVLYLFYYLMLILTEGIVWTVHVWTGIIVEAGIAGWLLSYLIVPPSPATVS